MTSKKMANHAKGWKSPGEKAEMKKAMSMNDPPRSEVKKAGKVAAKSPANTTKGKDSPDSKDGGPNGWTKGNKKPKGGGC